jgi:hypothetical protein
MEEAPLHSFDLQSLTCEVTLIDQAIAESGMADEFDLSQQDMRRLAVSANALMSVAVCAATDDEFAHLLSSFEPPRRIEEVGFLFGYTEHVRQQLLEALATSGRVDEFRHSLRRRIERAHALCRKAVLSA